VKNTKRKKDKYKKNFRKLKISMNTDKAKEHYTSHSLIKQNKE
jgi:hypothetical protein